MGSTIPEVTGEFKPQIMVRHPGTPKGWVVEWMGHATYLDEFKRALVGVTILGQTDVP